MDKPARHRLSPTERRRRGRAAPRGMSEFALITLVSISVFAALAAGITAVGATPAAGDHAAALPPAMVPPPSAATIGAAPLVSALSVRLHRAENAPGPVAAAPDHAPPPNLTPTPAAEPAGTPPSPPAIPAVTATPTRPAPLDLGTPPPRVALSAPPAPLEREHTVTEGETLSSIAARYGVTTETLVINNVEVANRPLLGIGQRLRIPPRDGLLYEVRLGDSVQAIARRFDVAADAIVAEPANRLATADLLRQGQVLLLPGARVAAPVVTVIATPRPTAPATPAPRPLATVPPATLTPSRIATPAPEPVRPAAVATPAPRPASGWMWPASGPLSSYFDSSHPLGIDIDLFGREGAPIAAARGGAVVFAGGNPCCSYGYYVEISHGDGFSTLYAHLKSPPPVAIGQTVAQGQTIGYGGNTGYSTGTHLHFEVRRGGAPVNPLGYLP